MRRWRWIVVTLTLACILSFWVLLDVLINGDSPNQAGCHQVVAAADRAAPPPLLPADQP